MRGAAVSFFAARINDESKQPIRILRDVNSRSWNAETNRFLNDIHNDTVALSGLRFFCLTRKLILSVSKNGRFTEIHNIIINEKSFIFFLRLPVRF